MLMIRRAVPLCAFLGCTLSACSGSRSGAGFSVVDSAGIEIVTNATDPASLPEWSLTAEPDLLIGVLDGDPALQFSFVLAGARFADGRVAVLDAGSRQVRFFFPDGRHQRSVGRRGDGPGEFQRPDVMLRIGGDSLALWDEQLRRITVLDTAGGVARTLVVPLGLNPTLVGLTAAGEFILSDMLLQVPESGFEEITFAIRRFDQATGEGADLAEHPGMPMGHLGTSGMVGSPLFAARPYFTGHAQGYWAALAREYEIAAHDRDGAVQRLVRWTGPVRETTAADRETYRQQELARASEARRERVEQLIAAQPLSPTFPAYERVMTDVHGALRVLEYPRPGGGSTHRWLVFDTESRLIARISVPAALRLLEWGDNHVLGVLPDADGVEQIAVFGVAR